MLHVILFRYSREFEEDWSVRTDSKTALAILVFPNDLRNLEYSEEIE
jgi:hypothetical protein